MPGSGGPENSKILKKDLVEDLRLDDAGRQFELLLFGREWSSQPDS